MGSSWRLVTFEKGGMGFHGIERQPKNVQARVKMSWRVCDQRWKSKCKKTACLKGHDKVLAAFDILDQVAIRHFVKLGCFH
jgi:hypothetical protein